MLPEITAVYEEMAREISKREPLLIVAPPDAHLSPLTTRLLPLKTNDTWTRDHGFITVEEHSPSTLHSLPSGKVGVGSPTKILLDFCFNGWGEKFPAALDNAINRHLHEKGMVEGRASTSRI